MWCFTVGHMSADGNCPPKCSGRLRHGYVRNLGKSRIFGDLTDKVLESSLRDALMDDVANHLATIDATAPPHIERSLLRIGDQVIDCMHVTAALLQDFPLDCVSAWNKDPVGGVIGV